MKLFAFVTLLALGTSVDAQCISLSGSATAAVTTANNQGGSAFTGTAVCTLEGTAAGAAAGGGDIICTPTFNGAVSTDTLTYNSEDALPQKVVKTYTGEFAANWMAITNQATTASIPGWKLTCNCYDFNAIGSSSSSPAASDCISGTSTVDVLNKGTREMKDVEVGDQVLTTNGYESVYAFAHRDLAAKNHVYSQIHFEGMTKPFEATARHLVYTTGKANPVTVDSLTLEDSLVGSNGEALKINKIKEVTRDGLFAPLTKSGDLLVDGIKISSYASLQAGQNEFAEFANGMTLPISQATGIHMFLAPLRMLCLSGLSTSVCDPSTYNENGMPHLVAFGINLASTADQQSLLVQVLMLAVVLAIFVPLYALESLVGANLAPAAIALGAGAFAYRNQFTSKKVKTV
jgi:hypothetical protein